MRPMIAAAGAIALLAGHGPAMAEDHEAGAPLTPAEAAGAWTVESGGRNLCILQLTATRTAQGYGAQLPESCREFIPGAVAAWQPTTDGMQLVGADGQRVIAFDRWSNSLFVSHRTSGADLQLKRGAPGT